MLGLFIFFAAALALGDVFLWLRYLRPTEVVWERRSRLIAAVLGAITPVFFLFLITIGVFK
jgi:hypothetical protein